MAPGYMCHMSHVEAVNQIQAAADPFGQDRASPVCQSFVSPAWNLGASALVMVYISVSC
jgi:hypothetical protein